MIEAGRLKRATLGMPALLRGFGRSGGKESPGAGAAETAVKSDVIKIEAAAIDRNISRGLRDSF